MLSAMVMVCVHAVALGPSAVIKTDAAPRLDESAWSEGLDAYLTIHLQREAEGHAVEHRRAALGALLDAALVEDADRRATERSDGVASSRALLILHMLRRHIGDEAFAAGVARARALTREGQTSSSAFVDAFVAAFIEGPVDDGGDARRAFLQAWSTRPGVPSVWLAAVAEKVAPGQGRRSLRVTLQQTQPDPPWPMTVPVVVSLVDGRTVSTEVVFAPGARTPAEASTTIVCPAAVARVDVDPFFEVLRQLSPTEHPPTIARARRASRMLVVTPTLASSAERHAWQTFARELCPDPRRCTIVDDVTVSTLPDDAAIWILGSSSYLRGGAFALSRTYGLRFDDRGLFAPGAWERVLQAPDRKAAYDRERVGAEDTAIVVVVEHPRNPRLTMAFVGAPSVEMIPAVLRGLSDAGPCGVVAFAAAGVGARDRSAPLHRRLALPFSPAGSALALALRHGAPSQLSPPPALSLPSAGP
jgi:hypothetical protein